MGIALSGFGSPEDIDQSRSAGFAEHLTKPVEIPQTGASDPAGGGQQPSRGFGPESMIWENCVPGGPGDPLTFDYRVKSGKGMPINPAVSSLRYRHCSLLGPISEMESVSINKTAARLVAGQGTT